MTIVLNEHEWAEEMITSRSLGKKPFETLCRVARYYLDNGLSKREVRKMLDTFLIQCDPTASLPKWADSLDKAISLACKYPAVAIDFIDISKAEIDTIDAIAGKQQRRLAFTLLCLAKYWNAINPRCDSWVNNKDSDIMRLANINTSIKRQSLMYANLADAGLISFSKKVDNTNVRVCFVEDGETALKITDFRNLGYQYMMYHGEPYFVCKNCGIAARIDSPVKGKCQKYCKECAAQISVQQKINSVMRQRGVTGRKHDDKSYTVYMHEFPDGKVYIGMTSMPLSSRWRDGEGYKDMLVGSAIKKYGWESVRHYVLFTGLDRQSAQAVEMHMIRKKKAYDPKYGYNSADRSYAKITNTTIPEFRQTEVDGVGDAIA